MRPVVRSAPRPAIGERNIEHRKQIRIAGPRGRLERQQLRIGRRHGEEGLIQRGLTGRRMRAHQCDRVDIAELVVQPVRLLRAVQRVNLWVPVLDLRHVQLRGLVGDGIAVHRAKHREGCHRCADAHADRRDHQQRESGIAHEAAQRQAEVIAGHHTQTLARHPATHGPRASDCGAMQVGLRPTEGLTNIHIWRCIDAYQHRAR